MAFVKNTTPTALAGVLVTSTSLGPTSEDNVTGNSSGKIYQIAIDNSANPNSTAYVKIADASSATPASTAANWIFPAKGGQKITYIMDTGTPYTAGISIWCTSTPSTGSQGSLNNVVSFSLLAS